MGDEDTSRFGPGKLEIGNIGVKCHPADVPRCQSIAGFFPGLGFIIGAKDPIFRPGKDHALAGNNACDMLICQIARNFMPSVAVTLANDNSFFGRQN